MAAIAEERLLYAAIRRFAKSGYSGTSIATIARDAGYSAGLVLHHFGSKLALLQRFLEHSHRTFRSKVEDVSGGAALPGIVQLVSYIDRQLARTTGAWKGSYYAIVGESLGAMSEVRPAIAESSNRSRAWIAELLRKGQQEGDVRTDCDTEGLAALLLATMRGIHVESLLDPAQAPPQRVRELLLAQFIATCATEQGRRTAASAPPAAGR